MTPAPVEDSLLPWLRSIKRIRLSGDKPKLLLCLTDCVKQFQDDESYREDLRYLRVCIQYADCSPEPWKVLNDLEKRNIGQGHTLFYEAYAMCLENRRKFGDADATYKRGLLRQAHPGEKLQNSYKLFRARMKTRIQRKEDRRDQPAGDNSSEAVAGHTLRHRTDIPQGVDNLTNEDHIVSEPLPTHDRLDMSFEEIRLEYWCTFTKTVGGTMDRCKSSCNITTEPIVSIPHRLPAGSFGDETIQIRNFAAEAIIGKETEFEDARHHGLVDPTINTKEALQDILNMFRKPLDIGKLKENGKSSKRQALRSMGNLAPQSFASNSNPQLNKSPSGSMNQLTELSVFRDDDPVKLADQDSLAQTKPRNESAEDRQDPFFIVCKDECYYKKQENESLHGMGTERKDNQDAFFVFVDEDLTGEQKTHQETNSDLATSHSQEAKAANPLVYDIKLQVSQPSDSFNDKIMEFDVFRDDDNAKVGNQDCSFETKSRGKSADGIHEPLQNVYKEECLQMMSGDDSLHGMAMAEENNQQNCFPVFKDEELDGKRKSHHESEFRGSGYSNEAKRIRPETLCDDLLIKADMNGDENLVQLSQDNCLPEEAAQIADSVFGLVLKAVNTFDDGLETKMLQQMKKLSASDERYHLYSSSFAGSNESITLGKRFGHKTIDLGKSIHGIQDCTKGGNKMAELIVRLEEDNMEDCDTLLAFKVAKPPCPWEFYICTQLDQRITPTSRHLFQHAHEIHLFTNYSILVSDYLEDGSLQDLLHTYQAWEQNVPEDICMFYTLEMLTMLHTLLSEGFVHGNFIPQNLLLRNHSGNWEEWTLNRPGCWKHQGLLLVDWSKSIDMRLSQDVRTFEGDSKDIFGTGTTEGSSLTSQVDIYGLCEIVHLLLVPSPLEKRESCAVGVDPHYEITTSFKKFKYEEMWQYFFISLLNANGSDCLRLVGTLRKKIEEQISNNPSMKNVLKFGLMKQNIMMTEMFPGRYNHLSF